MQVEICGPLGIGKTTLAGKIAERMGWRVVAERVENSPFLKAWFAQPELYAFENAAFFAIEYFHNVKATAQEQSRVIFDSGFALHEAYYDLEKKTKTEAEAFSSLCDMIGASTRPAAVLNLLCPPETVLQRIRGRGRDFESGVTLAYVTTLQAAIARHVDKMRRYVPVLDVDISGAGPDAAGFAVSWLTEKCIK